MKTLSIDIETYSDQPLAKTGVYRYVESSYFEILLFSYSVDGGPVRLVDLACGEQIPTDIVAALEDDSVTKWAFNANFERICLSRHLGYPTGDYLEPDSWKCSMVWAATMGLPLSLEGVGSVLGLEKQKLTEGKDLIKYFCQPCAPTKSNGQRTRNLPAHAPDKWLAFKKYNIRDVETEMSIQARLASVRECTRNGITEPKEGFYQYSAAWDSKHRVNLETGKSARVLFELQQMTDGGEAI